MYLKIKKKKKERGKKEGERERGDGGKQYQCVLGTVSTNNIESSKNELKTKIKLKKKKIPD